MSDDGYSARWACAICGAPAEFGIEPGYEYNEWHVRATCEHRISSRDDDDVVPVPDEGEQQ